MDKNYGICIEFCTILPWIQGLVGTFSWLYCELIWNMAVRCEILINARFKLYSPYNYVLVRIGWDVLEQLVMSLYEQIWTKKVINVGEIFIN